MFSKFKSAASSTDATYGLDASDDKEFDDCGDAASVTATEHTLSASKVDESMLSNAPTPESMSNEAVHTAATVAEEGALQVEELALMLGCNARIVKDVSEFMSQASEFIAQNAAEQAEKVKDVTKSNLLYAWAAAADLASAILKNDADQAHGIELSAESVVDAADAAAGAARELAKETDTNDEAVAKTETTEEPKQSKRNRKNKAR